MKRSIMLALGLIAALVVMQSCSAPPEKGLLSRYFHASTLADNDTMSSMAMDPLQVDVSSWKLLNVTPEKIEPAKLAEMNAKELELKKEVENHVGPTVDAKDALDVAKENYDLARTAASKAARKREVDDLQVKYDAEYQKHKELQQAYNDAKQASADEEQLTLFSLGQRELASARSLTGDVHSKEVDVLLELKSGGERKYRIFLKKYDLKDESLNLRHNGRWIITKFERID